MYITPMEIISFINHKGGVGKTTLCCQMAQGLAVIGQNVLCIDNDSQHSLTNRLGLSVGDVTIRDLYRGNYKDHMTFLQTAVRESTLPNLHNISSTLALVNGDVTDIEVLSDFLALPFIQEYYDFVLIDNHPGLDNLQRVAIAASSRLFIPVLLKQQSLEGLTEMISLLETYDINKGSIAIIPNIVENLKDQRIMREALQQLFGNIVIDTPIPLDREIERVEREQKILFLDRLASSKSAPYFIKLLTDLFPGVATNRDAVAQTMRVERQKHRSALAKEHFKHTKRN